MLIRYDVDSNKNKQCPGRVQRIQEGLLLSSMQLRYDGFSQRL